MVEGCCPLDWDKFGTSCYLFSKSPLSWNDARDWCNGHESHLVILMTDEEWVRQPEEKIRMIINIFKIIFNINVNRGGPRVDPCGTPFTHFGGLIWIWLYFWPSHCFRTLWDNIRLESSTGWVWPMRGPGSGSGSTRRRTSWTAGGLSHSFYAWEQKLKTIFEKKQTLTLML